MDKTALCIDLHGVLVNTKLMIANYEQVLYKIYQKYGVTEKQASLYHNQGLKQFSNHIKKVKTQKLVGKKFLQEMDIGDKEWDRLMQSYIPAPVTPELESRNIEFLAGSYANTFYTDARNFLSEIQKISKFNPDFSFFIVSNSHTSHIKGILNGGGFKDINTARLLGWDVLECLKSEERYFSKLSSIIDANKKVLIGNSRNEMVLGKKAGFKTIFITREFSGEFDFENSVDLTFADLDNEIVSEIQKFIKDNH